MATPIAPFELDEPKLMVIAQEIGATRRMALAMARNPGLQGISKVHGVTSLEAVLEDLTRAMARRLIPTNTGSLYARFLDEAAK
jgi:hypothetical protein